MKIKDTLKMLKYGRSPILTMVSYFVIFGCALVTSIPFKTNNFLGAFWANYGIMILIGQYNSIALSGIVQSSEKYKKMMTRNVAIIIGAINLIGYIIFILIRTTVAFKMGTEQYVGAYIFASMFYQLAAVVVYSVTFKKLKLGIALAVPMFIMILVYGLPGKIFSYSGNLIPLIIVAGITCFITPLVFYAISMLLYKVPFNESYMKRLERTE